MTALHLWARLGLLIPLLVACAAPQPRTDAADRSAEQAYQQDFVDEFARSKLKQNGPSLFCDQPGYLQCYEITQSQCLRELTSVRDDCFERTEKRFPNKLVSAKDINAFSKYYAVCMSIRHITMHPRKDTRKLGTCLKSVKWDKAQRNRSILK